MKLLSTQAFVCCLLGLSLLPVAPAGSAAQAGAAGGQVDEERPESSERPGSTSPRGAFDIDVQVKVVNVQVFVTDKKGKPITGLTVDDFEIYEDKKQVPITNFYEVKGGERTDSVEEPELDLEARRRKYSHPEFDPRLSQVPEDERLHLVVYIDNFNIRPFNRNRVFRYLRQFLRSELDRDDRVALMSYNRSLKYERPFTSDPNLISSALYEFEKHTGGRVQYDSERRDILRDIDEARDPIQIEGRIRLYAESIYNDMQFTIDALKEATTSLAGIPGRKALLYVSDGLPMRAGEEMFYAADEKIRQSGNEGAFAGAQSNLLEALQYDASRRFRDLTNQANANDVRFYTLDAAGLRTNSMVSAENAGFNTQFSSLIESVSTQNMQAPLYFMADRTGGQAITNTNNVSGGLGKIATDFEHYYSLGYAPGHAGSGRAYNLEVKVKGKGLRVRHREGYRDKSVETEMSERTSATLRYGVEKNDLGVRLSVEEEIRRDDGNFTVHLKLLVPIAELTLLPLPDKTHESRVRVWVQALDNKGGTSPVQANSVRWAPIPEDDLEKARKSNFSYTLPLIMRPGDQRISVGVRDDLAGRTSFVTQVIRVGS